MADDIASIKSALPDNKISSSAIRVEVSKSMAPTTAVT